MILYEYQTLFRQIFTDGRGLPEDPNPTWMGYSVGHWDGDALVVTTAGYSDRFTIDLEFVRDAKGAVTGMVEHWVEGDRSFARRK